jgi:ribulose-phosphate 3-epimerase
LPEELDFPKGARVGVAINPDTEDVPHDILASVDFIVVMGVYPGFGGARFEDSTYDSVRGLSDFRDREDFGYEILVDGGVNRDNILNLKRCGADHFVAGSGVFKDDPKKSFLELNAICDIDV